MSEKPKSRPAAKAKSTKPQDAATKDDATKDAATKDAATKDAAATGAAVEDGVSEASAEAEIAAIVEAEREAEAEEAAIAAAEAAADAEEPRDEGEDGEARSGGSATPARRLAVLGSPIGHSKSPALHRAAYAALGLHWSYEPADVAEGGLSAFIDGLGPEWRGLSLTMPLKKSVLPLLTATDHVAEQTGVANTVLLDGDGISGFNTDVAGIVRALSAAGLAGARYVHVLGGGATAASALLAAAELGAERVDVHVRDLTKSVWLESLAHQLGLMVRLRSFAQADRSLDVPELVISTLPGGASTAAIYTDSTRRRAMLLDVAYDPWPSALATAWQAVGGRVVSGLAMLAQQALLQVRIFVSGEPLQPLPAEDAVLEAMLSAVGIDAAGAPLGGASTAGETE